jgi:hypothetical protein
MVLIINPGSRIGVPGTGWTNTYEKARAEAETWLARMHSDGITDVVLLDDAAEEEGRWRFTYRHEVTGIEVTLLTHGIDDIGAYERDHIFAPYMYWNESSTAEPKLEDFAAPGFRAVCTFTPVVGGEDQR